jgi:hypothetical protein
MSVQTNWNCQTNQFAGSVRGKTMTNTTKKIQGRRIVVQCKTGQAFYVRSGVLYGAKDRGGGHVSFLKLTRSKGLAMKFSDDERDAFIHGIHAAVEVGFYPQFQIEYCS